MIDTVRTRIDFWRKLSPITRKLLIFGALLKLWLIILTLNAAVEVLVAVLRGGVWNYLLAMLTLIVPVSVVYTWPVTRAVVGFVIGLGEGFVSIEMRHQLEAENEAETDA